MTKSIFVSEYSSASRSREIEIETERDRERYFTVLIYLATSRAAKLGILLILRSQTYPGVAKANISILIY